jgi:hypothetical protein
MSAYTSQRQVGAPTGGSFRKDDTFTDAAGIVWVCLAGGIPGAWAQQAGGGGGGPAYDDEDEVGVGEIGLTVLQGTASITESVMSDPLTPSNSAMAVRRYSATVNVTGTGLVRIGIENCMGLAILHSASVEKSDVPLVPVACFAKIGFFDGDGFELHFDAAATGDYIINGTIAQQPPAG